MPRKNIVVLLVDDETVILELLTAVFEDRENCTIISAMSGEEALELARSQNPDIIILDIQLPGMDGYRVCSLLKAEPSTSHIKVIMLTGMAQESDLRKAQLASVDAYIVKPFRPVELMERVEELLNEQ